MSTIIRKWGNSLGIRVPKSVAEQVGIHEGAELDFDTTGGVLTLRPKKRKRQTLASLLAKAKGPSPYRYLDSDARVGRELL